MTKQAIESTYRLQFHHEFPFRDAIQLIPYLQKLGITHVYASPYFKARPGSKHGYDVVDHRTINPEIGTREDHDRFIAELHRHGMGLILDIVPNHMGTSTQDNPWWENVLENGRSSPFAEYFDIAWRINARPELRDKVLLPVLGQSYGEALETGQIKLRFDAGSFAFQYYEQRFPVDPSTYEQILAHFNGIDSPLANEESQTELDSICTAIRHLPRRSSTDPELIRERQREKEIIKRRLATVMARHADAGAHLQRTIDSINGRVGQSESFDRLDELLSDQAYRLSHWRVALEEINYRRFFDVNDLAALAIERDEVFDAVHSLPLELIHQGQVDGLRIDHPDGLYDPKKYFERLKEAGVPYVVIEKILDSHETLPRDWLVEGTTGYEFLNVVNGLFVEPSGERVLTQFYRQIVDEYAPFAEVVYRCKKQTLATSLAGEWNMLAHQLDRLAQHRRASKDFTLNGLREALGEVIAVFPVYRTYLTADHIAEADQKIIDLAIRRAIARNPLTSAALYHFIRDMLLLVYPPQASEMEKQEQVRFVGKFQQLTSPVTAKGIEDTAFYTYNRFISLNEVGGNPGRFGNKTDAFHKMNRLRQSTTPLGLNALSTHDTKRSEDVRARLNAISEYPQEWCDAVKRWQQMNEQHRVQIDDQTVPDANEEYLYYQMLIGTWPCGMDVPDHDYQERLASFALKALHEAKVHSSWINPNAAYDEAAQGFIRSILDGDRSREFLNDFRPLQRRIAEAGAVNTLSQTLLKLTSPGVADLYQGMELPDLSMVDPDNRRPVDYALRSDLLNALQSAPDPVALLTDIATHLQDGRAKLLITWQCLQVRTEFPGLMTHGEYQALTVTGKHAQNVIAYQRSNDRVSAVVIAPRVASRIENWADTTLEIPGPAGRQWRNRLTGQSVASEASRISIADALEAFPVALLLTIH